MSRKATLDADAIENISNEMMTHLDRIDTADATVDEALRGVAQLLETYGLETDAAELFCAWLLKRSEDHGVAVEALIGVALAAFGIGAEAGLGGRLVRFANQQHPFAAGIGTHNDGWMVSMEYGQEAPDSPMAGGAMYGHGPTLAHALAEALGDELPVAPS